MSPLHDAAAFVSPRHAYLRAERLRFSILPLFLAMCAMPLPR